MLAGKKAYVILFQAIITGAVVYAWCTHTLTVIYSATNTATMNKADIISKVHETLGGTKADAERAVEAMLGCIVESLTHGNEVSIAGLGIFSAKMRPARQGSNPRTGESIQVPAMRVPKFRAAKALKDAVKG